MPERWMTTLSSLADEPMSEGLLERAKEGPRLPPPGPSAGRRAAVAVVALAIGVAAVLIAVKSIDSTGTVPTNEITESQYGWSATVPEGWTVTPYRVSFPQPPDNSLAPSGNTGLAFSNFEFNGRSPEDYTYGGEPVPDDGALLLVDGGASTIEISEHGEEMFPIQLQDGSGGIARSGGFSANGMHYEVLVFEGSSIDDETRGQVDGVVASIRFPEAPDPLPGQADEFEPGVISLGRPDNYPARSLTPLTVHGGPMMEDQSILLVHAPDGFYALRGVWSEPCRLEWHAPVITGCDAHPGPWNKFGHKRPGTGARLGLVPLLVGVNFDGRLLTEAYSRINLDTRSAWNRR